MLAPVLDRTHGTVVWILVQTQVTTAPKGCKKSGESGPSFIVKGSRCPSLGWSLNLSNEKRYRLNVFFVFDLINRTAFGLVYFLRWKKLCGCSSIYFILVAMRCFCSL